MGKLTTHVLDTANGQPGRGIAITIFRIQSTSREVVGRSLTNADGRCEEPLLSDDAMPVGRYELEFAIGDYFRALGNSQLSSPAFLEDVVVRFSIANSAEHYHVPLLVSPYSYSTYRGS